MDTLLRQAGHLIRGRAQRERARRSLLFIATVALLAAAPVAAQPPSAPRSSAIAPEMTITGCLRSGPNPGGVPEPVTYTLEPIVTTAAPAPTGSVSDAAKAKTATRYTLTAEKTIDLSAHVGHTVELRGRLKDLSASPPDAQRDPPTPSPKPGGAHNTFEVATLKMVAARCP